MRTVSKAFIVLCLAASCAGGAYAHKVCEDAKFETVVYHERVRSGDTLDGVLSKYYNYKNERDDWDTWKTKMANRNKRLFFYADGKTRYLQSGDIVCIEVRQRMK